MPMLALSFASLVSVALIAARILWTSNLKYGYLAWNLFLAWVPLGLAFLACDQHAKQAERNWRFYALAGGWLLFFPNAPYIFTDVIHLTTRIYGQFWVDLVLILLCALTGLVLGFVSLFLMQTLVARRLGRAGGWLFIAAVAGLSGFGIYLGRFLRFNSWDIVYKPFELCVGVTQLAIQPQSHPHSLAFPFLFAIFLFIAYVMLYALTHLRPAPLEIAARPVQ